MKTVQKISICAIALLLSLQLSSQISHVSLQQNMEIKNKMDLVRNNFKGIDLKSNLKNQTNQNQFKGISEYGDTPSWNWVGDFGGTNTSSVTGHIIGLDTDLEGNFYTYGYVSGVVDYFGSSIQKGTFLSKQNQNGEPFWIVTFSDLMIDDHLGNYITLDPSGEYIYIAGVFDETFNIPEGPQLIPALNGSIFILKYDVKGNYISVIQEDVGFSNILCLAADHSGNILLSGTFQGQVTISGESLTSFGLDDVYIVKYNSSLSSDWLLQAGGSEMEYVGLISFDNGDNIYLTGEFWSENVLIGTSSIQIYDGDGNIILAKLSPNGTTDWITSKAGSLANQGWGDTYCWPTGIISDPNGYLYIKGWHGDSTWFDNYMLRSPYFPYSYFVAKFDGNGNTIWANSIHEHNYGFDYNQFDCDSEGNVYLGAQATDTIHFDGDFEYINAGPSDLFVAKYLSNGELDWVKTSESSSENNWLSSVAVSDTNLYIGGSFSDFIKLDDEVLLSDVQHGFIAMTSKNTLGFREIFRKPDNLLNIYPNPFSLKTTIRLSNFHQLNHTLQVFDLSGKKVLKQDNIKSDHIEFKRGNLPAGVYLIELQGENTYKGKLIIN